MSITPQQIDYSLMAILAGEPDWEDGLGFDDSTWQVWLKHAKKHGMAELIYWSWQDNVPTTVPYWVVEKLQQRYITTLARNRLMLLELDEILKGLGELQIEVILLKGAVFSRTLYEDIGIRPMSDLDILLHKADIEKAVELLSQRGYYEPVLHQRDMLKKEVSHDIHLRQINLPHLDVEVHWLLGGGEGFRQKVDMDWFWQTRMQFGDGQPGVYVLSPTATVLYLCAHLAFQHGIGMSTLLWYVDIARFLEKYSDEINWEELIQQAAVFQWNAAVFYTLSVVQENFGVQLPDTLLRRLQQQISIPEERFVREKMVTLDTNAALAWSGFKQLSWSGRVKDVFSRVFPSLEFMKARYGFENNTRAMLGYPYRWAELINKMVFHLRKRWNRKQAC